MYEGLNVFKVTAGFSEKIPIASQLGASMDLRLPVGRYFCSPVVELF